MESVLLKIDEIKEKLTSQEYLDLMTELQKAHKPDGLEIMQKFTCAMHGTLSYNKYGLAKQIAKFNEFVHAQGIDDEMDPTCLVVNFIQYRDYTVYRLGLFIVQHEELLSQIDEICKLLNDARNNVFSDVQNVLLAIGEAYREDS